MAPEALGRMLVRMNNEYRLPPIYITESGCALDDQVAGEHVHDTRRIKYVHDHLAELRKTMRLGVNIRGYFVWSLLDNFEWAHGFYKTIWHDLRRLSNAKAHPKRQRLLVFKSDNAQRSASLIQV